MIIQLVKLNCGLHYGRAGHACAKCASGITQRDIANQRNAALLAAIQPVDDSIQERAIQAARAPLTLSQHAAFPKGRW